MIKKLKSFISSYLLLIILVPFSGAIAQTQIGIDIDGENTDDQSGYAVSLSADGRIVAIGARNNPENGTNAGHVRVFEQVSGTWIQMGQDIDGPFAGESTGNAVSLSANGKMVAIGGPFANDNTGVVRVYAFRSGIWTQVGTDIPGVMAGDNAGFSVGLSASGNVVAMGGYASNDGAGDVRIFEDISGVWTQIGSSIIGEVTSDWSGYAISLSDDGQVVAIGSPLNSANGSNAGHVRVYENNAGTWTKIGENIEGEAAGDLSGVSLSLSGDGQAVAIGAYLNDGNGSSAGHVRVYKNVSGNWMQQGTDLDGEAESDQSGFSVSLSEDGSVLAIGAVRNTNSTGHVRIYQESAGVWTQLGDDIDGELVGDQFGNAVSISDDGAVVAIGAILNGIREGHTRIFRTGLPYTSTDFLDFSFSEQANEATINIIDHTLDITVLAGTDMSAITPTFRVSDGATTTVSGDLQVSGTTTLDFTNPVTYTITAEDGVTNQDWTVTVSIGANTAANFVSFSFGEETNAAIIDTENNTITIEVENQTDISDLIATFSLSDGATAKVNEIEQISAVTANDFTESLTYQVTAEDGTTVQDWIVTVTQRRKVGDSILGEAAEDQSGSVAMSIDGRVVAVGAYKNSGNGNDAGHVRVYQNLEGTWTQWGEDIDGEAPNDQSGRSVSLSADGNRVAIGANQNDGIGENAGHVRVFENQSDAWVQIGNDIDGEAPGDRAGIVVSLSADGNIVAIGAALNDEKGENAGHVQVFKHENDTWIQMGEDIDGEAAGDFSGEAISLSSDGKIVAIGAGHGDTGGYVRVFEYIEESWTQLNSTISGDAAGDFFGSSVSLSADGQVIAIGAGEYDGTSTNSGLVRVYENASGEWVQLGNDLLGENAQDIFGSTVSLSANGKVVVIGAPLEDGSATNTGSVRIFQNSSGVWTPTEELIQGSVEDDRLGSVVSTNAEGTVMIAGAPRNDDNGTDSGQAQVWETGVPLIYTDFFSFSLEEEVQQAVIDNANHTIDIDIVFGTDITQLVPDFTLSYGANAMANSELQLSGVTPTDFSNPVVYTITSGDRSIVQEWTVTASVAPNIATDFVSFSIPEELESAIINTIDHTIELEVEKTIDVTALIPSFVLSEGATAQVEGVVQTSGETTNDFSETIIYTVTAQDGITFQTWEVTVSRLFNTETDFLSFSLSEQLQEPVIDAERHTISTMVAYGTDLSTLTPSFSLSLGAEAYLQEVVQVSGTSKVDFTFTVPYLITAEDAATQQQWLVRVSLQQKLVGIISGEVAQEKSGSAISLDASGHKVAIGAPSNSDVANSSGQVSVFEAHEEIQMVANEMNGSAASSTLGGAVSMNADGTIVAIGAEGDSDSDAGYVRVYKLNESGNEWKILGDDIPGEAIGDRFGQSVSLSANGRFLAVGADTNDAGNENTEDNRGHVRVFEYLKGAWIQIGEAIEGEAAGDRSGFAISLSADGQIVAIGAISNGGSGTTAGHVRVYQYDSQSTTGNQWQQLGEDIDGEASFDRSGYSVSLSGNGKRLATGARWNDGTGSDAGHVRIFDYSSGEDQWQQVGEDIDGEASGDNFGWSVSLSTNGEVVAIGAIGNDASGGNAGHVRVYQYQPDWPENELWQQLGMDLNGAMESDELGSSVSINADGTIVAIGAPDNDEGGEGAGQVQLWETGIPLISTNIWAFTVDNIVGEAEIDLENHTIALAVADGTDRSQLTPVFALPYQANVTVDGATQNSGEGVHDFTNPTTYTVISGNGKSMQDWIVTIDIAPNSATDFLSFSLPSQVDEATIDPDNHTIDIMLTSNTDITRLQPNFNLSEEATVTVNGAFQMSGETILDFSEPIIYSVTASNDITCQDWVVSVEVEDIVQALEDQNDIKLFPNPAQDYIRVSAYGKSLLRIYDLSGIVLLEQSFTDIHQIDISNLKTGLHFVEVQNHNGSATRKFIKID